MPTPPIPGWKDPVAIGMRSPILRVAFWPSTDRSCGFCINFVFVSEKSAVTVAWEMVTWKSVAFRLASEFRLIDPLFVVVVGVVVVPVGVVVVLVITFGCNCTDMLVGGLIPRVRF